jgi:hypothetical protein
MKRRNVQQAFVGEPTGREPMTFDNLTDGDEAVDIEVRGGKVMLVVPAGTADTEMFDRKTFVGGELELEDGRVLSFQIQDGAVGALAAVHESTQRDRSVGLSSIPDIPSGT